MIEIFNQQLANELYNSKEQFPVDLDMAWKWLGYSAKQKAKEPLVNQFRENVDYTTPETNLTSRVSSDTASVTAHKYFMTVDCFKCMGMLARTEQGDTIRQYFLNCERTLKELVKDQDHYMKMSQLQLQVQAALKELKQKDEVFYISCIQSLGLVDKTFADDRLLVEQQRTQMERDKLTRFLERANYLVTWIRDDIGDFCVKDSMDKYDERYKDLDCELKKIEKLIEPYNVKELNDRHLPYTF